MGFGVSIVIVEVKKWKKKVSMNIVKDL